MIVLGILAVLILFYIGLILFQEGFSKDALKSLGAFFGLIFGLWVLIIVFCDVPATYFLAASIPAIIALEILIKINNKSDAKKRTVKKGDVLECIFLLLIPFLMLTSVFAFSSDSIISSGVSYINELTNRITGNDFPFRSLFQIFPFSLIFALITYRNKKNDEVLMRGKDIKRTELEYKACYVVEDLKESCDKQFKLSDITGFALRFGFTSSSKKVIFIIYSIIGIVYDVLSFVLKEPELSESCIRGGIVTLVSFILNIFVIGFINKCHKKYYKHITEIKTKATKYKSLNPEVDSLLAGRWYENVPLKINCGIELFPILHTHSQASVSIEISPGLHSLVYYGAGELLNKKYDEYLKSKKDGVVGLTKYFPENPELNDQEVKFVYKEKNLSYYFKRKDSLVSADFDKSEIKIFSVADAKTNEEKASLIISELDDYIQNHILKIRKSTPGELITKMNARLCKELPVLEESIIGSSASLSPFEFMINYCGKELLRYNLVDCKDGTLVKTIEEIYKQMTSEEFALMLTNKFIDLTEKTLIENKDIFSSYKEICSKNKNLFVHKTNF